MSYHERIMIPEPDLMVLIVVLTLLNVFVFFRFAADKFAARKNIKRTSERTLIFLALLGPFGAYGAMKVFRHKTQKLKFYLIPLIAVFHIFLIWSLVWSPC
jgi:uncharacterized membrane protein YsdA (DUF1294 family)